MGLISYIGHRLLAFVLVILGVVIGFYGLISGSFFWIIIAVVMIIAAAYFFKTQH